MGSYDALNRSLMINARPGRVRHDEKRPASGICATRQSCGNATGRLCVTRDHRPGVGSHGRSSTRRAACNFAGQEVSDSSNAWKRDSRSIISPVGSGRQHDGYLSASAILTHRIASHLEAVGVMHRPVGNAVGHWVGQSWPQPPCRRRYRLESLSAGKECLPHPVADERSRWQL